jgi:hypothetical protein
LIEAYRKYEKVSDSCYIYLNPEDESNKEDGLQSWMHVAGKPIKVKGFEWMDLFVHKSSYYLFDFNAEEITFTVTEGLSGMAVCGGSETIQEAKELAEKTLHSRPEITELTIKGIEKQMRNNGHSPRYKMREG